MFVRQFYHLCHLSVGVYCYFNLVWDISGSWYDEWFWIETWTLAFLGCLLLQHSAWDMWSKKKNQGTHHHVIPRIVSSLAICLLLCTVLSLLIFVLYITSKVFSWTTWRNRGKCAFSIFLEAEGHCLLWANKQTSWSSPFFLKPVSSPHFPPPLSTSLFHIPYRYLGRNCQHSAFTDSLMSLPSFCSKP